MMILLLQVLLWTSSHLIIKNRVKTYHFQNMQSLHAVILCGLQGLFYTLIM